MLCSDFFESLRIYNDNNINIKILKDKEIIWNFNNIIKILFEGGDKSKSFGIGFHLPFKMTHIKYKKIQHKKCHLCNAELTQKNIDDSIKKDIVCLSCQNEIYEYNTIPIKKYTLEFIAKSNKSNIKFQIYTGIKWVNINDNLNQEYKYFTICDTFDFNSNSGFRIGLQNINDISSDCEISIFNPIIKHINVI
tara:strand:+ start:603 stop:1181 length:579 start_codon:yes stop_codon:yes gene_type:complete